MQNVLGEEHLEEWATLCCDMGRVFASTRDGKTGGDPALHLWVQQHLHGAEARLFRLVDPPLRAKLRSMLAHTVPGGHVLAALWETGVAPSPPAPAAAPAGSDKASGVPSAAAAAAGEAPAPASSFPAVVSVRCPAVGGLQRLEGRYRLSAGEAGVVNGLPFWWGAEAGNSSWVLYSSPQGVWTFTDNNEHFATGTGCVMGTYLHEGFPPTEDGARYQHASREGQWVVHGGIVIAAEPAAAAPPPPAVPSAATSRGVPSAPQQQQQQQQPDFSQHLNPSGMLTRQGFGHLRRAFTGSAHAPSPSVAEWAQICRGVGCTAPEDGLTLPQLLRLLSNTAWLNTAQQQQQQQPTAPAPAPAPAAAAVEAAHVEPSVAGSSSSRTKRQRCGACEPCLHPLWKKSCERVPGSVQRVPRVQPASQAPQASQEEVAAVASVPVVRQQSPPIASQLQVLRERGAPAFSDEPESDKSSALSFFFMMTPESGKRDFLEVGEQEAAAVGPARRSDAICWDV